MRYLKHLIFATLLFASTTQAQWRDEYLRDSIRQASRASASQIAVQSTVGLVCFTGGFFLVGGSSFLEEGHPSAWLIVAPIISSFGILSTSVFHENVEKKPIAVVASAAMSFLGALAGIMLHDRVFGSGPYATSAIFSAVFSVGLGVLALNFPFPD